MLEYEKFQELQAKSQKMQEDYERQLQEMEENRERALEELTEYYETKLQEMTTKLEQVSLSILTFCVHVGLMECWMLLYKECISLVYEFFTGSWWGKATA